MIPGRTLKDRESESGTYGFVPEVGNRAVFVPLSGYNVRQHAATRRLNQQLASYGRAFATPGMI
jgi:hypothetical protein